VARFSFRTGESTDPSFHKGFVTRLSIEVNQQGSDFEPGLVGCSTALVSTT
jgi:hypothetical protein